MKINTKSIAFKLVAGGIALVLLPLMVVGYLAYAKAHSGLTLISKEQAKGISADLARLTRTIIDFEQQHALTLAAQRRVVDAAQAVKTSGIDGAQEEIKALFEDLKKQFGRMDRHYQGIYVADSENQIYTGVLEGGGEYKRIALGKSEGFLKAMEAGKPLISELVKSAATGEVVTAAVAQIKSGDGAFLGTVGLVIKAEFFTKLISDRKVGETGYGWMIDTKGIAIAHPKAENVLTVNLGAIPEMEAITRQMMAGKAGVESYRYQGVDKIAGYAPVGHNGWSIAFTQNAEEFEAAAVNIRNWIFGIGLLAAIVTVVLVLIASKSITRPIKAAVDGLKDIAQGEGDLTMRLKIQSQDEVGALALWFNTFMEKLQGIIRQIASGVGTLSAAATELSQISAQMTQAAQSTLGKSNTVAAAAEEMSTNMRNVAAAMEQASSNTQAVATAAEEMSATINEIAKNSEKARTISGQAAERTNGASSQMENLGEAANAIGKVIETITEISEQVNLLALNATIEAARAGDAGKGFAVVANEIKELAKQTASATQEIKAKVQAIQGTTTVTIKDIGEITRVIAEVNDVVGGIATAVVEQSTATSEIAGNVAQSAQGIQTANENVGQSASVADQISKEITDVNATADEMSSSSGQVHLSSQDLSKLAEQLQLMVNQFKY